MYWVLELAQSVGDDAGLSDIIVAVADVVVAPLSPPGVSDRGRSTELLGKGVGGRTSPWGTGSRTLGWSYDIDALDLLMSWAE